MANLTDILTRQRRFQQVLVALVILALVIGVTIVPIENAAPNKMIRNAFDGIWWSITTITSVGYGDVVPVTTGGKVLGMILQVAGVLAFGLLVSLVTVSLDEAKERYYRNRLEERLDRIESKLDKIEKQSGYVVRERVDSVR